MKIQKTTVPVPTFESITISITIESEEELETLQEISKSDLSFPRLIGGNDEPLYKNTQKFCQLLNKILF